MSYLDIYNNGTAIDEGKILIKNKVISELDETADKKRTKEIENRLNEYYDYFSTRFNFKIDKWKKLSIPEKVNMLIEKLNIYEKLYVEESRKELYNIAEANPTIYNYLKENIEDDFAEKVQGLEPVIEEKIIKGDRSNFQAINYTYTDEKGKQFIKQVRTDLASGNEQTILLEKGASFPDYENIKTRNDNTYYYETKETTNNIPDGYVVAKDRSEGKNGKLIIVPEDKSLLPDGAEVKSDGRGGWILTAPESAYKENGNLNLKEDPNLYSAIKYRNIIATSTNYETKINNEMQIETYVMTNNTKDGDFGHFLNEIGNYDRIYQNDVFVKENGVKNIEFFHDKPIGDYVDPKYIIGLEHSVKEDKEAMAKDKEDAKTLRQELLNKISGYGK